MIEQSRETDTAGMTLCTVMVCAPSVFLHAFSQTRNVAPGAVPGPSMKHTAALLHQYLEVQRTSDYQIALASSFTANHTMLSALPDELPNHNVPLLVFDCTLQAYRLHSRHLPPSRELPAAVQKFGKTSYRCCCHEHILTCLCPYPYRVGYKLF
jgi:hypothetical protein